MSRPDKITMQSDDEARDARKRQEIRNSKPAREWTAEERREAFREARRIEAERAEAGIAEEWVLCEECHEYKRERGFSLCQKCIKRIQQYEG